jgi:hypothetical protein
MSKIFDTGKQLGLNYTRKDDRAFCIINRTIANNEEVNYIYVQVSLSSSCCFRATSDTEFGLCS